VPIPEPVEFVRTRWLADPDARGAYSFLAVGSSTADRLTLQRAVGGRLWLAGEASSVEQPGTVSGALLEGHRVAREIGGRGGHVVVVGAGAAGLACASALHRSGDEVVVVESRDRIGGRVRTVPVGSARTDVGASWIHGVADNPLTSLVESSGSTIVPTRTVTIRREDGSRVDDREVDLAFDVIEAIRSSTTATSTGSIADHFDPIVATLDPSVAAATRAVVASEVVQSEGADLDDASIACIHESCVSSGDEAMVAEGLTDGLEELARGLDIRLRWRAREVAIREKAVAVADVAGDVLETDRCVVTVPLGVLQSDDVIFTPPLPIRHRAAIGRLGMGLLDKIVMRFRERFWDDTDMIYLAGDAFDIVVWSNLERVTGEPVLVGYVAGRAAATLSDASDSEVRQSALRSLTAMYG
jgi:monoamine oxidase